jgi:hypothetical protein
VPDADSDAQNAHADAEANCNTDAGAHADSRSHADSDSRSHGDTDPRDADAGTDPNPRWYASSGNDGRYKVVEL